MFLSVWERVLKSFEKNLLKLVFKRLRARVEGV